MTPDEVRAIVREELDGVAETVLMQAAFDFPSKEEAGITADTPVANDLYDALSRLLAP